MRINGSFLTFSYCYFRSGCTLTGKHLEKMEMLWKCDYSKVFKWMFHEFEGAFAVSARVVEYIWTNMYAWIAVNITH